MQSISQALQVFKPFIQSIGNEILKFHPLINGVNNFSAFFKNEFYPFNCHVDLGTTINICMEGKQQWYTFDFKDIDQVKKVSFYFL